jgi:hypothetical protein
MKRTLAPKSAAIAAVASILGAHAPCFGQGADDHAATAALVRDLEQDAAHSAVTADATAHARESLERAVRLRGAGDEVHAREADALAREWAETGRDLVRAAVAEQAATDLLRKAVEGQARVERARALVEESIARVGRLTAQLEEAGKSKDHASLEPHEADSVDHKHGGAGAPSPRRTTHPGDKDKPAKPASTAGERP